MMAQKLQFPILYIVSYCNCTSKYIHARSTCLLEPDKIVELDKP